MSAKKVVVAMSGGVDSSVTAALLKDKGLEVIGITMQIWKRAQGGRSCCGLASVNDAKKVAYKLGIPHYVLNFRDIFREKVIIDFCQEYQRGRTPNPCIRCNKYIKFDALLKRARQLDADFIATGHYARIKFNHQSERYILQKGVDTHKEQSYVLYMMTQKQLKHTLMPLGELTKKEVRQIALDKDLPVANKSGSQEICFIPDNHYGEFIKAYIPQATRPGPIVNNEKKVIGEHQGIVFYTIGQRKGIGIADSEPLYVTSIDQENNTIKVGRKEDVYSDELIAEEANFIYFDQLKQPLKVKAKVRYLHPPAAANISPLGAKKIKVKFNQVQWAVTPGQAAVFYSKDIVIGGGTIACAQASRQFCFTDKQY